jgi:hypothetical protein
MCHRPRTAREACNRDRRQPWYRQSHCARAGTRRRRCGDRRTLSDRSRRDCAAAARRPFPRRSLDLMLAVVRGSDSHAIATVPSAIQGNLRSVRRDDLTRPRGVCRPPNGASHQLFRDIGLIAKALAEVAVQARLRSAPLRGFMEGGGVPGLAAVHGIGAGEQAFCRLTGGNTSRAAGRTREPDAPPPSTTTHPPPCPSYMVRRKLNFASRFNGLNYDKRRSCRHAESNSSSITATVWLRTDCGTIKLS